MKKSHVISAVLCLVCSGVLFYLHFAVYGRLLLNAPEIIGVWCAGWLLQAVGYIPPTDIGDYPRTRFWVRLIQLVLCIGVVSIPYILFTEPYDLDNWIFILWAAMLIVIYRKKLDGSPYAYAALSVGMLVITGVFLLIAHPITAQQAQNIVEQAGYTNCVYDKPDPEHSGYYRFTADWNGQPAAATISAYNKGFPDAYKE